MGLRTSKGNMYGFIDFTWNPIKGKCEYDCIYCFMKKWKNLKPPRIVEEEFKEFDADMRKYGEGHFIFIGSSIDMFAPSIPSEWLQRVFRTCYEYNNTYLFQTKNPKRYLDFVYPFNVMLGTTLESNRDHDGITKDGNTLYNQIDTIKLLMIEE